MPRKAELLSLTERLLDRRLAGDFAGMRQFICDDIHFNMPSDGKLFAWAGVHEGADAVIEAVRLIDADIIIVHQTILEAICEGNKLVLRCARRIANRGASGEINIEATDYLVWRGDKLASFVEHFDTEAVQRLLRAE